MRQKLWLVTGIEKSSDRWWRWSYYVLADNCLEAERLVRDYECRKFEAIVARYKGVFKPKHVVAEWNGHGNDIVSDLRDEGVADLFWWEIIDGEPHLCNVRQTQPRGVR